MSLMQKMKAGSKKSLFGWDWRVTSQTGTSQEVSVLMDIREMVEHLLQEQREANDLTREQLDRQEDQHVGH